MNTVIEMWMKLLLVALGLIVGHLIALGLLEMLGWFQIVT